MNHCWQSFPSRFSQFQTHCGHRGQRSSLGGRARQERASAVVFVSPTILDALEDDLEASAMSIVPASSLAIRCLGRDCTHVDRETMDDPMVEAPQLQHGDGFRQIEAGPTQCDSVVSMPVASVPPTVLASSGASASFWFRNQALHGLFRTLRDSDVESRAVVNQYDMTAADSENGDGSHPSRGSLLHLSDRPMEGLGLPRCNSS